jgi:hypothetical protein
MGQRGGGGRARRRVGRCRRPHHRVVEALRRAQRRDERGGEGRVRTTACEVRGRVAADAGDELLAVRAMAREPEGNVPRVWCEGTRADGGQAHGVRGADEVMSLIRGAGRRSAPPAPPSAPHPRSPAACRDARRPTRRVAKRRGDGPAPAPPLAVDVQQRSRACPPRFRARALRAVVRPYAASAGRSSGGDGRSRFGRGDRDGRVAVGWLTCAASPFAGWAHRVLVLTLWWIGWERTAERATGVTLLLWWRTVGRDFRIARAHLTPRLRLGRGPCRGRPLAKCGEGAGGEVGTSGRWRAPHQRYGVTPRLQPRFDLHLLPCYHPCRQATESHPAQSFFLLMGPPDVGGA